MRAFSCAILTARSISFVVISEPAILITPSDFTHFAHAGEIETTQTSCLTPALFCASRVAFFTDSAAFSIFLIEPFTMPDVSHCPKPQI